MKISLVEPIGISREKLEELVAPVKAQGHEFNYYETKAESPGELISRSEGADIVMLANGAYPAEVIRALPDLKMIDVAFTGIDHVGVEACRERGIMICNASGYSDQAVAELILGMAVSALRSLQSCDQVIRRQGVGAGLGGSEICGKTVGIIGLGRIGMRTAELFKAFGARVMAYSRTEKPEAREKGIIYGSLEEVLEKSDIISLNLPLNPSTRGFLSRERIALMKDSTVFINCARGPIVDNSALAEALSAGRLAYVCADVFDTEPPIPEDYPLLNAPNTLLTPHIAYATSEAMERRAKIVFENLQAYLQGSPVNVCR